MSRSLTLRIENRLKATVQRSSIGQRAVLKFQGFKEKRAAKSLAKALQRQLQQSEKEIEPVDQWWDKCHSNQADFGFWLTGSAGVNVWSSLQIEDLIGPGQVILNIGVGQGHCTRELSARGCQVHALDISPVALSRISDCVVAGWLPSQLSELPSDTFDVAISHLVAQHMSDPDLEQQIREVVRGLKPKGVFALQFAFLMNGGEAEIEQTPEVIKSGGICRSLERIRTMVEGAGGQIVWSEKIGTFAEYGSGWYGVHIQRKL